jgi:GR25 family glycosyltransferase involved in LPS biosynthesis
MKHEARMENIEKQRNKLDGNIILFDAVKGDSLDIDHLIENGKVSKTFELNNKSRKRVLGCFLSHLGVYKEIKIQNKGGYSIIFEDDFNIKDDDFIERVYSILNKLSEKNIDFDILFLGNLINNYGENIVDNIYHIDYNKSLIGLHGYLINNKNIDKIITPIGIIDRPIDIEIEHLSKGNNITSLVLNPVLVDQGGSNYSSINDMAIENYTSYL